MIRFASCRGCHHDEGTAVDFCPSCAYHPAMVRRRLALALAVLLCATGCTGLVRRTLSRLGLGTGYATGITEEELSDSLDRFARRFGVGVGTAAERIESESRDREVRRRALLWKLRMIPPAQQAAGADAQAAFVTLLTMATAQRKYLTVGEGAHLFGDLQPIAVAEAEQLERDALALGATFLAPEELEGIRWQVEDVTWKYPIRGVFQVESAMRGIAESESWGAFTWVVTIPLAPFRALEGVDTGAQAILEFNGTAREFSRLVAQLPQMMRWESQLLLYDVESRETVQAGLDAFETVAASAQRLSEAAERLPADVRAQLTGLLADADARQGSLRETLADARGLLAALDDSMLRGGVLSDSLRQLAEQVDRTGATMNDVILQARGPEPPAGAPPGRPFDILDYERTLARTEAAAAELRGLATDLRGARESVAGILDAALWRLLALLLAFFGLRLAFRRLEARLARRRAGGA